MKQSVSDLHPELQPFIDKWPKFLPVHSRLFRTITNFVLNLGLGAEKVDESIQIADKTLSNGKLRVYISESQKPSGLGVLFIHGGGLVIGNYRMHASTCVRYVNEFGAVVCSPQYRFAPDHPYPAALEDCFEAWRWMQENASDLGIDPERIVVAGASAGGGLAAKLAQHLQDEGGIQPVAQSLHCPMLDDRSAANCELDPINHIGCSNMQARFGWDSYLGCNSGSDDVPEDAVPARRENLADLPPTWIGIGKLDVFYEDSVEYARRLQRAGVPTTIHSSPGGPHGFEAVAPETDLARTQLGSEIETLRRYLF